MRAGAGRARTLKVEYNKKVKEEDSEGVHELVQLLAESRGKAVGMQMGRDISRVLVGQVTCPLSVTAVRAYAGCQLIRLRGAGGQRQQGGGDSVLGVRRCDQQEKG